MIHQVSILCIFVLCNLIITSESASIKDLLDDEVDKYEYALKAPKQKCMDDLGCFVLDDDFYHILYRPFNLLPADRESINTRFLLHTPKNIKQFHLIRAKDPKSVESSNFNAKIGTKFIIHGYIDNQLYGEWMRILKNEFLMHGDYNVIIVDWSGGNKLPYTQATSNTRVVGAEIAFLVNYLAENYGLQREMVHILGHSLGAHVAGYAGERIPKLGRITGLDPAEPFFQDLPTKVRLDATDAKFVDIIHTDSKSILQLGLGMSQLCGHVDFFPNNGMENPGCIKDRFTKIITDGIATGARAFVACNHQRAVDFMVDSINEQHCHAVSYMCPDWEMYLAGRCTSCGNKGERCAIMGMRAIEYQQFKKNNESTKMYFKTSSKPPFCLYSYHIRVRLQTNTGKDQSGSMSLKLHGSRGDETFEILQGNQGLYPGSTYTSMVTTSSELGQIESATFEWKSAFFSSIFSKKEIFIDNLRVEPLNAIDNETRDAMKQTYCGEKGNAIASKEKFTFSTKHRC